VSWHLQRSLFDSDNSGAGELILPMIGSGDEARRIVQSRHYFGGRTMHIDGGCHCGNISYECD
jgi:2-keto-3-deoxy-L-rhamnonate aldolase RhmA